MNLDTHVQANDPYTIIPHYRELYSGIKEDDKSIYKMAYPSSIYPILNLGYPIYDNLGNKIESGHYELALSIDKKHLLFIQSKKLIARILVLDTSFDEDKYKENYEKYEELKRLIEKYQIKRNRKRVRQYQKELEYFNRKLLAQNVAEIDDKNPNYFIIKYRCNFATATGIIKRASQD